MANPLYDVPGLGGYLASQDRRRAMGQQDMEGNIQQMKLADLLNATEKERAMQRELGSLTPEQLNDPATRQRLQMKYMPAEALKYREPPKVDTTPLITNLRAAGIEPSSPEGQKIIRDYLQRGGDSAPYLQMPTAVIGPDGKPINVSRKDAVGKIPYYPTLDAPARGGVAAAVEEGKALGEQRGMIPNKQDALTSVNNALGLLNKGIYTGAYAGIKKAGAKYTPGVDTEKATRTEEFISEIGNTIVPRLKEFGGNDSNEELKYLQRISGGDITLEEGALRAVLNRAQMKIQRGIDRVSKGLDPNGMPAQQAQPKRIKFDAQGNQVQ